MISFLSPQVDAALWIAAIGTALTLVQRNGKSVTMEQMYEQAA